MLRHYFPGELDVLYQNMVTVLRHSCGTPLPDMAWRATDKAVISDRLAILINRLDIFTSNFVAWHCGTRVSDNRLLTPN